MTYKTMKWTAKHQNGGEEMIMDGWLKKGTDQGWTLHSMHQERPRIDEIQYATKWTFIWETND
jgi:hypothetical protein